MPYSPLLVKPMRDELTAVGVEELLTGADVDRWMSEKTGVSVLIVNSVCGCAAGSARPGVRMALDGAVKPERVASVFAGQDLEAVAAARGYFADIPPSSPSIALFSEGELAYFIPRHRIESRDANALAEDLRQAFVRYASTADVEA